MIYLSENLRAFRKKLDRTQEEVAAAVGVTPQSVSKWERGETLPDVSLLPALANYFRTSIDALIGMEKINDDTAHTVIFRHVHAAVDAGDLLSAVAQLEDALHLHPSDCAFAAELAICLALTGDPEQLSRAIALGESVLAGNSSEKLRHTTRAALCFLYEKAGDHERARAVAGQLPHRRESREEILQKLEQHPNDADLQHELRYLLTGTE